MLGAVGEAANLLACRPGVRVTAHTHPLLTDSVLVALIRAHAISAVNPLESNVTIARAVHAQPILVAVVWTPEIAAVAARVVREAHAQARFGITETLS